MARAHVGPMLPTGMSSRRESSVYDARALKNNASTRPLAQFGNCNSDCTVLRGSDGRQLR